MLRAIHFSPLPCSDLGQGVAISTTAFTLPRFFVQMHIFSVSPSSFRVSSRCSNKQHPPPDERERRRAHCCETLSSASCESLQTCGHLEARPACERPA